MTRIRATVRDQFAMAALQGMLASAPIVDRTTIDRDRWSKVAYEWADAMLAARKEKK